MWRVVVPSTVVALILVAATSCTSSEPDSEVPEVECESVIDAIMKPWATGDAADVEAIYDPAVRMLLDGDVVATNREELTAIIVDAVDGGNGNTYTPVGPCSGYLATDGDTYVSGIVNVGGSGHPSGVPVVGFYRVRDGLVIRHVAMDAEHY